MKIVTGYGGTEHITSNDWQGLNQGIVGTDSYVLDVGNKFAATMPDATHVNISDGEGVLQGVHFRTEPGATDSVTIDAGSSGSNRIDLICARYTKNSTTGVENVEWAVIKGTAVSGDPLAPSYTTGDVLGGDTLVDYPMFKVTLSGVTPTLTSLISSIASINGVVNALYWAHKSEVTGSFNVNTSNFTVGYTYTLPSGNPYEISVNVTVSGDVMAIAIGTGSSSLDIIAESDFTSSNMKYFTTHTFLPGGSKLKVAVLGSQSGTANALVNIYYRRAFVSEV